MHADDELEIRTLVSFHGKSNVQYILDITPLNEVRSRQTPWPWADACFTFAACVAAHV